MTKQRWQLLAYFGLFIAGVILILQVDKNNIQDSRIEQLEGKQGPEGEPGTSVDQRTLDQKIDEAVRLAVRDVTQGVKQERGPAGENGQNGFDGATGSQGLQGLQGPKGKQGPRGPQGERGPAGIDGVDGVPGTGEIPGEIDDRLDAIEALLQRVCSALPVC